MQLRDHGFDFIELAVWRVLRLLASIADKFALVVQAPGSAPPGRERKLFSVAAGTVGDAGTKQEPAVSSAASRGDGSPRSARHLQPTRRKLWARQMIFRFVAGSQPYGARRKRIGR